MKPTLLFPFSFLNNIFSGEKRLVYGFQTSEKSGKETTTEKEAAKLQKIEAEGIPKLEKERDTLTETINNSKTSTLEAINALPKNLQTAARAEFNKYLR